MSEKATTMLKPSQFPVFIIEEKRRPNYTSYDVVRSMRGFVTFSRLPEQKRYTRGKVFDSEGRICRYKGECGWPRFSGMTKTVLEALILPPLLSKLAECYTYFGPKLTSSESVSLKQFKKEIIDSMRPFEKSDFRQLVSLTDEAANYTAVLEEIDWFRYHGGKRDNDGHPI